LLGAAVGFPIGWAGYRMQEVQGSEYYTAEEACALLGVKLATLYSYVNRGLLTSYRQNIRRQRLYMRSEVEALLTVSPASRGEVRTKIPLAESWAPEH
jgi:excisionase family DNA binding protein